jgi:transcriptional regulator with XRE-family HTH domain
MSNDHPIENHDPDDCGSFAMRLFHARSAIPLTQEALADMAGLQQSAVAHYEAGRREPSLANLRNLTWALGCGADYLLATRRGVDLAYRHDGYVDGARPPAAAQQADPRTVLLGHLAEGMREALATGDVEAARIAHETIGRLLGAPGADAAGVIDLAAERTRRDG